MSEENRKIVIVVGAGASCDFVVSEDKKFNENHGNIKYEIWGNSQTIADKDSDKNAQYFLSEKNRNNYSFPSGEALIKMISDSRKVFDFFGNEILDEIYQDVKVKINWDKHHQNDDIMSVACKEKFLKYFFEYLKNPIYQNKEEAGVIFSFDESIGASIEQYKKEIGVMATEFAMSRETLRIKKFSNKTDFFRFIYIEVKKNLENERVAEFLNNLLRENFRIKISQLEDAQIRRDIQILLPNGLKLPSLFENILEVSSSRYLQISRLVNYYQPFSIDELLDSIKTKKIDVFKPLELEPSELKSILKDSENKTENELENQFRNELINAGKTLIALFLLQNEKRDLFDNPNPQNDTKIWYRHIRNLIINSGKDSAEIKKQIQNLTIISFNYDRSLDYYLRTRLSDYYGEIKERVFYPYGKLAVDNWDCNNYGKYNKDGKFNPYNENELREIEELGQGLRVIGELDEEVVIQEEFDEETKKKLKDFQELKKVIGLISQMPTNTKFTRNEIKNSLENQDNKLKKICKYLQDKNEELSNENPKKKIIKHHQKDCEFLLKRVGGIYELVQCHKIYFLGFAFHQANCNLLGLNQLYKINYQGNIYYTNFDESESINNAVKEIFIIGKEPWKLTLHDSKRKGVYDALMHDFKLGF